MTTTSTTRRYQKNLPLPHRLGLEDLETFDDIHPGLPRSPLQRNVSTIVHVDR